MSLFRDEFYRIQIEQASSRWPTRVAVSSSFSPCTLHFHFAVVAASFSRRENLALGFPFLIPSFPIDAEHPLLGYAMLQYFR